MHYKVKIEMIGGEELEALIEAAEVNQAREQIALFLRDFEEDSTLGLHVKGRSILLQRAQVKSIQF
ncbi:hypothetical protein ACQ4M3_09520 [Leptolyngbya sp. AN03gr2]|uniref:hypothetical protein n=1 Tax=Leptolyngbya sp. AN03gr2 TaxID=3423364 RepID=UPI003D30FE65